LGGAGDYAPEAAEFKSSDNRNCRIGYYTLEGDPYVTWGGLTSVYNQIRAVCESSDAAGFWEDAFEGVYMGVFLNPDYESSTVAETNGSLKARTHPRDLVIRQNDGDTESVIVNKKLNVVIEAERKRVVGPLPSGSSYMIQESEAQTQGISMSVEFGASFFEIFSASAGLEISQEFTVTSTTGVTVNVDCPEGQNGIIYWQPIFIVYQGFGRPSMNSFEVRVPSNVGLGSYSVACA
jgi:hypothetical protein